MITLIRQRQLRSGIAFVLGLLVALLCVHALSGSGATIAARTGASGEAGTAGDFTPALIREGEPCPSAVRTTTDEISKMGLDYWLPHSDDVPPLDGTWMCTGTPTFDYGGITFAYEPGWRVEDPAASWAAMAEQWGRVGVETVLDRPAFVMAPSEAAARGEVLVLVDGTLIRVIGTEKTSIETLVAAVNSIRLDASSPPS